MQDTQEILNKIYVANIARTVEKQDVENLFSRFGEVEQIEFITESSGLARGWGLVTMKSVVVAQKIVEKLNAHEYKGKKLRVSLYRKRSESSF